MPPLKYIHWIILPVLPASSWLGVTLAVKIHWYSGIAGNGNYWFHHFIGLHFSVRLSCNLLSFLFFLQQGLCDDRKSFSFCFQTSLLLLDMHWLQTVNGQFYWCQRKSVLLLFCFSSVSLFWSPGLPTLSYIFMNQRTLAHSFIVLVEGKLLVCRPYPLFFYIFFFSFLIRVLCWGKGERFVHATIFCFIQASAICFWEWHTVTA